MEKQTVFFDLDGTLTDSGPGIMNCAEEAFRQLGYPVPDRQQLRVFVGPPLSDSFQKFGIPESEVSHAIEIFRKRYTACGKYENSPYPGILHMLQALNAEGFPLYVATSKPEVMALDIMEHFELAPYFRLICGATLDRSRVTKEEVLTYLLEKAGLNTSPLMIGDTIFDVEGAKSHGIPTIGVSWGYGSEKAMMAAGAAAIAHCPEELLSLIQNYGRNKAEGI